jgi:23S rRNA pseudouridine2605 synthase
MAKEFKRSRAASGKKAFGEKKTRTRDPKHTSGKTKREEGFKEEERQERRTGDRKPAFEKKSRASKGDDHSSFKRYRDHGKPSDFGGASKRSDRYGEERDAFRERKSDAKRSPGKRSFNKERSFEDQPSFSRKKSEANPYEPVENDSSEKKSSFSQRPSGKRPFKEKSFGDQPSFSKRKKEVNPYDLDESDFEYASEEDADEAPNRKKTRGRSQNSERKKTEAAGRSSKDDGSIRLNKYISNAGICSRREADELIASGVVQVNGKTITEMGFKVKPSDIIKYGGQTLKKERMVYLILNKPKDYITTVDDPQKRKTVLELVQDACRERIYPVGRLDRSTTGLLMFTNDGELTKKLTHPKYGVRKIYHVELDKPLKKQDFEQISEGLELEDGQIKVDEINYVGDGKDKSQIGIELHSGKNRIVRRIFEHLGYNVRKLDRVMFGPLTKKDLPRGRWRFLTPAEVGILNMISSD